MSYLTLLGTIMAIHLAAVVSPGPSFLVISQTSIRDTRRYGLISAAGVALGSALLAVAALFGVSVLFETAAWLYGALKLLGGAYLVYLGVQSWRHAKEPLVARAEGPVGHNTPWRAFRTGFLTNLTNPKAVVFFGSIFASLLTPSLPLWVRGAAVGVILFNNLWWFALVAVLFSTSKVQRAYARAKHHIDRVVGGLLALIGLRLMFTSR